ncbi:phage tail fiber protein [Roseibium aggregatum]|uniref:Uncharacterized protein n=1 Tax=Roseibium aggregatum TaxID=187304 RepID=A0A0M6Y6M1_9HYPH|nr:hypothetical protein [Roseibium aggregatum]CTQ45756.1 hypothetical protein LAL4801_04211 [Roseibium aggregatum]
MAGYSRTYQAEALANIRSKSLEIALYVDDPTSASIGTEVTGGAYARPAITFGSPVDVGDGTEISNNGNVIFPQATTDWASGAAITHYEIREVGGGAVFYGPFDFSRVIRTGDFFRVDAGNITLKEAD